ncbi:sigma-70 family RNA polymerase sigma factor [Oceanobacillus neutriphilus]|uniref:RNA polymerase sigma factor n=1 Tax=Oceanobacillus neutriphilus TaxID=531815 RepID=A0ABQ2NS16_9BACI|nr:sigma-70 family RNA polymerase sigma factor [Oceanobacillus neutriphilus]GGP09050.1 ECF RNA polymerase sigma factor SigM [Oceanobacillus neutriphilus]
MKSIDQVYQLYFRDIYQFLLSLSRDHYTAEDLVQETFLRAYLYLEFYHNENVKSWLFTVAYRTYIDYYRKHRKSVVTETDFFQQLQKNEAEIHHQLILSEEVQEVLALIDQLPDKQRTAIILHDIHELSYKEASQIMDVKLGHFKILLFRGRQAIRQRKDENQ